MGMIGCACLTIDCWQHHSSTAHITNAQQYFLLFNELQDGFVDPLYHAEGAVEAHRAHRKHLHRVEARARSEGIYKW